MPKRMLKRKRTTRKSGRTAATVSNPITDSMIKNPTVKSINAAFSPENHAKRRKARLSAIEKKYKKFKKGLDKFVGKTADVVETTAKIAAPVAALGGAAALAVTGQVPLAASVGAMAAGGISGLINEVDRLGHKHGQKINQAIQIGVEHTKDQLNTYREWAGGPTAHGKLTWEFLSDWHNYVPDADMVDVSTGERWYDASELHSSMPVPMEF